MGKLKIKKAASKRFKVTKNGKVIFSHQYAGHLMRKKSSRRKRRQEEPGILRGAFAKRVRRMLGKA